MTTSSTPDPTPDTAGTPAERAIAEARERRRAQEQRAAEAASAREINGRDGPEPVRYGDWEVKGRASDF